MENDWGQNDKNAKLLHLSLVHLELREPEMKVKKYVQYLNYTSLCIEIAENIHHHSWLVLATLFVSCQVIFTL